MEKFINKLKGFNLSDIQKRQFVNVVKDISKEYGGGGGGNNANDIYMIRAENGEDLGASGKSYKLYSTITNQLIQSGTFTIKQFEEIFGISFKDFYNNINYIQIFSLHTLIGGSISSIVSLDGKFHDTITEDDVTAEIYFKSFNKSKVKGWFKGLFSVNINVQYLITTDITEPMIDVNITIIDDDEIS